MIFFAACGGRIAPDEDAVGSAAGDATNVDAGIANADAALPSIACGSSACTDNLQCCVGAALGDDSSSSLERCSSSGACNTSLQLGCWTSGECAAGNVCCITFEGDAKLASSSCAATCGGSGQPAVQACGSDDECPSGSSCIVAAMGPINRNQNVEICAGVR